MAAYFGVAFGSSSSCVAVYKDSKVDVLANDAGDRVTPAVISYNDGELSVGLSSCHNPANIIAYSKSLIGYSDLQTKDVANIAKRSLCKIVQTGNGELAYELTDSESKVPTRIGVQQSLELVFKKLLETASSHSGVRGEQYAVLTAPVHFDEQQKLTLKNAAIAAGFQVLQVIHEPSAALLAYQVGQQNENTLLQNVVIFRAGGTSVDTTVIVVRDQLYRILSSVHKSDLGGEKVTELLASHLAEEFKRKHRIDVLGRPRSVFKLHQAAETCKRVLSTVSTTSCSVDSLFEGMDFSCTVSRARLESLLNNLIPQFIEVLDEALLSAKLKLEEIDKVVFVGGTCKIPRVQQILSNYFPNADILNQYLPDEVIAMGAANQAANLKGCGETVISENEFVFPTVTHGLHYKVDGDASHLIFNAGTLVPAFKEIEIPLPPESTDLHLEIMESNNSNDSLVTLAKVVVDGLLQDSEVLASFRVTRENTLEVIVKDQTTTKMQTLTIE